MDTRIVPNSTTTASVAASSTADSASASAASRKTTGPKGYSTKDSVDQDVANAKADKSLSDGLGIAAVGFWAGAIVAAVCGAGIAIPAAAVFAGFVCSAVGDDVRPIDCCGE